jgi:DNA-binding FadR family transcriptional regulator
MSRADDLADRLSLDVLQGRLAPGARLPSVRALAKEHEVSASTVQRVLALLEARGLVLARDRSGVIVQDPLRHSSLSTWPLLVRHARAAPVLAHRLVADALRTRRTLAVDVLGGLLRRELAALRAALVPAVVAFVEHAESPEREPAALCAEEHELLRTVLVLADRPAVLGIVNGIERVITASPELVQGLYADPFLAVAGWQGLLAVLDAPEPLALLPLVDQALEAADVRALAVFAEVFGLPPLSDPSPHQESP